MQEKSKKANPAASAAKPTVEPAIVETPRTSRRRVLEWSSFIIGSLVALFPVGLGFWTFLDPWLRKSEKPKSRRQVGDGKEGFIRVASLDALQVGGSPQRFPVIADQIDAWNFTPNQPVGAVFLHRISNGKVRCFNATCPHAGCSVSCINQAYVCPCHNSAFNLDGTKQVSDSGRENPSPRDLDNLIVDEEKLGSGEVWVQFMNFYTGEHEKIPKT